MVDVIILRFFVKNCKQFYFITGKKGEKKNAWIIYALVILIKFGFIFLIPFKKEGERGGGEPYHKMTLDGRWVDNQIF